MKKTVGHRWVCMVLMVCVTMGGLFALDFRAYLRAEAEYDYVPHATILEGSEDELGQQMVVQLATQNWQGIQWINHVVVAHPNGSKFETGMIFITGSFRSDARTQEAVRSVAVDHGIVTAALYDIPNQPLFGGLREDHLIAYTFDQYLETGDDRWPLLLPMVRSVIRVMNWMQEEYGVRQFVLAGGSKRGWTTYLTAVVDDRVRGIVPMAYDFLNFPAQLDFQMKAYGDYSDEISEYTELGLHEQLGSPEGSVLRELVDPYIYRSFLTMPKLIPVGANDPYWHAESWQFYLNDLPGYSKMVYVPNAGHDMEIYRPLMAIRAMVDHVHRGIQLPDFDWTFDGSTLVVRRILETEGHFQLIRARALICPSHTRDFRKRTWISQPMQISDDEELTYSLPSSAFPYMALFMELHYIGDHDDQVLVISTPIVVRSAF